MKGAYSTTPDTRAATSISPMAPRNSIPGRPRNMSVCSCQQELHDRMTGDQGGDLAAGLVDGFEAVLAGRGVGRAAGDVHHRPILVEAHEGRNLARMQGQGRAQHLVQVQKRPVRVLGLPGFVQQHLVQLVGEHQRQAGDAPASKGTPSRPGSTICGPRTRRGWFGLSSVASRTAGLRAEPGSGSVRGRHRVAIERAQNSAETDRRRVRGAPSVR